MTAGQGERTVLLRIHGRVQGVAYRAQMQREAHALGLSGWVRNRGDGTVEACVWGPQAQVQRLLDWAQRGPPGARVERVERVATEPADAVPQPGRFEIRSTL